MKRNFTAITVVVSMLQTVVIVYLLIEINLLNQYLTNSDHSDNEMNVNTVRADNSHPDNQIDVRPTHQVANGLPPDNQSSEIDLIRQAMRQELHTLLADKQPKQHKRAAFRSQDPVLIEEFTHQLDMFISQGSISTQSMESFHAKLALLSPHDQKNILSHMAQAINNGQLKVVN